MMRNINFICRDVKTLIAFVCVRVANKHTWNGLGIKLMRSIWSCVRITHTHKNFEEFVIKRGIKQDMIKYYEGDKKGWQSVNYKCDAFKHFWPVNLWNLGMKH
jgi:hypothetical protein